VDLTRKVPDRVRRVYDAVRASRIVIYANPDDEVRVKVLRKLCELANLLGVKCIYIGTINLIKTFNDSYDRVIEATLEEVTCVDSDLIVIDNFELYIFIERLKQKFIDSIRFLLEREKRALLGTTPEALTDSRVSIIKELFSPTVIIDFEERNSSKKVKREVVSLFRRFIAAVSGVEEREDVFVV